MSVWGAVHSVGQVHVCVKEGGIVVGLMNPGGAFGIPGLWLVRLHWPAVRVRASDKAPVGAGPQARADVPMPGMPGFSEYPSLSCPEQGTAE